jgi:L-iditol 2-dehydrogenase
MRPGRSVLVIGSGIAGLLHIHAARMLGAALIAATDIVNHRLDAAREFGADAAFHAQEYTPARLRELNRGRLADMVIVCAGAEPAIMQALDSVERGGTVLFFAPTGQGVTIPLQLNNVFWRNDVTLTTSYAGSPADYATALEWIGSGSLKVKRMITHRLGLAETGLGFQMVANPQKHDSIKVVIEPQR